METERTQEAVQHGGRRFNASDGKRMGIVECRHAALQHRITDDGTIDTYGGDIWDGIIIDGTHSGGIWDGTIIDGRDRARSIRSSIVVESNDVEKYSIESEGIGIDIEGHTVESEGIGTGRR